MKNPIRIGSFVCVMNDGNLVSGRITKIQFNSKGEFIYFFTPFGESGKTFMFNEDTKFYPNEVYFRDGIEMDDRINYIDYYASGYDESSYWLNRWIMKDGEPTEIIMPIKEFILSDFGQNEFKFDGEYDLSNTYENRQECLDYNEYTFVDEKGNTHTRIGHGKLLELTDEQKKLVKKFMTITDELKKKGVSLVVDHEEGDIGFLNHSNLEMCDYEWCRDGHNDAIVVENPNIDWHKITDIHRYEDYTFVYIPKENNE